MPNDEVPEVDLWAEVLRQLAAVDAAVAAFVPGGESSAVIELPKLALADALLRAVGQRTGWERL